jgi:exopolysaccharide biosynthesis protein
VISRAGRLRLVSPDSIPFLRRAHDVRAAFQSYPTLLEGDGDIPVPLRQDGTVSRTHVDARLAIGELRDGRIVVVLTRFDALGDALGGIPLGLTTPGMAALMGALGCRRAVMLDGGISAQLLVRDSAGVTRRWTGIRRVPMGLVAFPVHSPG